MRLTLLALLVAGPLAAQANDPSAAIRRAAIRDTTEKLAGYRVVGDTAWATVVNPHASPIASPASGFPATEVRLVRRGSDWSVVATTPVMVYPSRPVRPAKPFSFADTAKRP